MLSTFLLSLISLSVVLASTLAPPTVTLTARKGVSPRPRRGLVRTVSEPLLDQFDGTDLQWFGNISFGTPSQTFLVVFDTGSFDSEIPGIQCGAPCVNQHQFNFTASSTFVSLNKTGSIDFATGGGVEPSDFESLQVLEVNDTMTLLGIAVPETTFFLITNQTAGFFSDPYDGIVGMGFQPEGGIFPAMRNAGLPAMFSMFLTPHTVGNAELTLGGVDQSKLGGKEPVFSSILPPTDETNFWSLGSSQIVVNNRSVASDLFEGLQMVFDSGTSNIVMPTDLTVAMYALISPEIKPFGTLGAFGFPCDKISTLPAVITFTFPSTTGAPFNLTIPSEELNVGPLMEDPNTCQTLINALDEGVGIIGGSLLKHYYSIWDVDNARMGFVSNGF